MNKITIETDNPITIHSGNKKSFKKPNSDYYRLDLIVRGVVDGRQTEDIKTDYMSFVKEQAYKRRESMAKYIQELIGKEMDKDKSAYRQYLIDEISRLIVLPFLTDSDHAVLETLQNCLATYDKLEV